MTYRTLTEIEADITIARAAINTLVQGGQSYMINSGGSSRQVTQVDLPNLNKWLSSLKQEARDLEGSGGLDIGAAW